MERMPLSAFVCESMCLCVFVARACVRLSASCASCVCENDDIVAFCAHIVSSCKQESRIEHRRTAEAEIEESQRTEKARRKESEKTCSLFISFFAPKNNESEHIIVWPVLDIHLADRICSTPGDYRPQSVGK